MFCEILTFLSIYILINCFLWYRKRIDSHQRFIRKGIKGPKPSLISGNLYQLRLKDTPNEVIDEWIQEYGNHFGYFLGDKPFLVINDLDSIQKILITNSKLFRDRPRTHINAKPFIDSLMCLRGDDWRRVRRVITPFFSHHKVCSKEITDIISNSVNTFIEDIEREECKTPIIEVSDRMQSISLDVICKCALNMFNNDVHQKDSQLKSAAKEFMEFAQNLAVDAAVFFPFLRPVLAFVNNYMTAGRMTDMIVRHLNKQIKFETESISSKSNNFETNTKSNNMLISMLNCYLQQKITKDELIGNAVLVLLAGYDTTSMGLTYAFYLLAKHQQIQDRLRQEINSEGHKSQYLEMVWNETLRLYPPVVTFITREAAEDVVINDIFIEKDTIVQVPVWHIHHDPQIWPEPYKFDPQRFAPQNKNDRHSASFLSFGLGPRICVGVELAAHEAKLTLSMVLTKYRIEVCDQTPDPIRLRCPTVIIYPKDPIYLRFVPISADHNQ